MNKVYRVDYDYDRYKAMYISALQLVHILAGKTGNDAGGSLASNWMNIEASLEQRKIDALCDNTPDITFWHHSLALSEHALSKLESELEDLGEFLPVKVNNQSWYVFNLLTKADSYIDMQNSEKDIENNTQVGIKSLCFSSTPEHLIFKTDYDSNVRIFCTDKFKNLIEDNELSGLRFDLNFV